MRLRSLAVLATAALVGVLAISASASGQSYHRSAVTIHKPGSAFGGAVRIRDAMKSPQVAKPCQRRRIRLYWKNNGGHVKVVGSTISNRMNGHWAIRVHSHQGDYFAVAKRRVLPRRGGAVCARARSRTIHVAH